MAGALLVGGCAAPVRNGQLAKQEDRRIERIDTNAPPARDSTERERTGESQLKPAEDLARTAHSPLHEIPPTPAIP